MFTVNPLSLSLSLASCLVATNVIESPHSGMRLRTRRVCRWRDGKMVLRWAAAALLMTEGVVASFENRVARNVQIVH